MFRVIIESPYAGDVERNVRYAQLAMRDSLDRGESPYASHLLYTQPNVLDDSNQRERERGLQAGYEWMQVADLVAFYVDHRWSPGMIKALKIARMFKRKVEHRFMFTIIYPPDTWPPEVQRVLKQISEEVQS